MSAKEAGEAAESAHGSRRGFLATLAGLAAVWIAAAIYPVYRYLAPRPAPDPFGKEGLVQVDGITAADVSSPGAGKNGGYAGRGLILYRAADGRLRAFDAKCTHAGCNVKFEHTRLACPCHGGIYDLEGRNAFGPPPRPLVELQVIEKSGALFVARKA